MKSAELAQRWAEATHSKGRANNAYFAGADFYHYGTRLALRTPANDMAPVVLINRHKFSSGTSKVQGELEQAAKKAGLRVFTVDICATHAHVENLADYESRALEAEDRKQRARNPDAHQATADRIRAEAADYARAFIHA